MLRFLLPIALLTACGDGMVNNIQISGTDGLPVFSWSGGNAEIVQVSGDGGTPLWYIAPEDPPDDACLNELDGSDIEWNVVPAGYVSTAPFGELDDEGNPPELDVPESLEDGEYSVGFGQCIEAVPGGMGSIRSYENRGASFTVVDGVIGDVDEAE